jgi:hypothetical protein
MLLAAMMAMALVAAAPAFAQNEQTSGGATTGDVAIANSLGNQCVQIINQQNTGNVNQEQDVEQTAEQNLVQINAIQSNVVEGNVAGDVNANGMIGDDNEFNQTNVGEQNIDQTVTQEGIEQAVEAQLSCTQALAIAFFK